MQFLPIHICHIYFYMMFFPSQCLLPGPAFNHVAKTVSGLNSSREVELIQMCMTSLSTWLLILMWRDVFSIFNLENTFSQVAVLIDMVIIIWSKSKMFFCSVGFSNKLHQNTSNKFVAIHLYGLCFTNLELKKFIGKVSCFCFSAFLYVFLNRLKVIKSGKISMERPKNKIF